MVNTARKSVRKECMISVYIMIEKVLSLHVEFYFQSNQVTLDAHLFFRVVSKNA